MIVSAGRVVVVVVGSIHRDLVLRVDELPAPGEAVHSQGLSESTGGKGANQAVAATAAGASTRMVGAVGAGDAGPRILDDLTARGIDVSGVLLLGGAATGRAVVTVDARGENSIVVAEGANGDLSSDAVERALTDLGPSDVVVLQNEMPMTATAAAARAARARGARVVWNAAPAPSVRADVDLLVVNEGELAVTRPGAAVAIPSRAAAEDCRDPLRVASNEGKTG